MRQSQYFGSIPTSGSIADRLAVINGQYSKPGKNERSVNTARGPNGCNSTAQSSLTTVRVVLDLRRNQILKSL